MSGFSLQIAGIQTGISEIATAAKDFSEALASYSAAAQVDNRLFLNGLAGVSREHRELSSQLSALTRTLGEQDRRREERELRGEERELRRDEREFLRDLHTSYRQLVTAVLLDIERALDGALAIHGPIKEARFSDSDTSVNEREQVITTRWHTDIGIYSLMLQDALARSRITTADFPTIAEQRAFNDIRRKAISTWIEFEKEASLSQVEAAQAVVLPAKQQSHARLVRRDLREEARAVAGEAWLYQPNAQLAGQRPIDLIGSEAEAIVRNLVEAMARSRGHPAAPPRV